MAGIGTVKPGYSFPFLPRHGLRGIRRMVGSRRKTLLRVGRYVIPQSKIHSGCTLVEDALYQEQADLCCIVSVPVNQCRIANKVDEAGYSSRVTIYSPASLGSEQVRRAAGAREAVANVADCVLLTEWHKMVVCHDPLGELAQIRSLQCRSQLGLTDQNQLQNLIFVSVNV